MSYHIYTTEGILLKKTPFGEANMIFHILTEDLGLIIASAQGIRASLSKLSSALQEYSYSSVSYVKGKNGWKITNAFAKKNYYFDMGESRERRRVLAQIVSVIIQMIPGESIHREVFHIVRSGFDFLSALSDEKYISSTEILILLRILYELGYVAKDSITSRCLSDCMEWNTDHLAYVHSNKLLLVATINKAIKASQL